MINLIYNLKRSGHDLLERINYIFALIFVLLIPFNNRYFTYLFIPWAIVSIILASKKKIKLNEIIKSSFVYLVFYFISMLSLLYSIDFNYGIKTLETLVSLIIMPFLLLTLRATTRQEQREYMIKTYLIGLILYILISFVTLFIRWDIKLIVSVLKTNTILNAACYFELSFFLHRSYISMYLVWGIVLIVNRIFQGRSMKLTILGIVTVSVFLLYIILLGSRAALITLAIVTVYYLWKLLLRYSLWVNITFTGIVLLFTVSLMIMYTRIGDTVIKNENQSVNDIRISLWTDAFEVFKDAPLFGQGVGDGVDQMIIKHKENGNVDAFKNRLNAHNQFLETATQTGIIGLLSLICILLIPFIKSIRNKQELLFLFISIITVNFLVESMLVRLAGVLFLAFWLNFLLIIPNNSEPEINGEQVSNP